MFNKDKDRMRRTGREADAHKGTILHEATSTRSRQPQHCDSSSSMAWRPRGKHTSRRSEPVHHPETAPDSHGQMPVVPRPLHLSPGNPGHELHLWPNLLRRLFITPHMKRFGCPRSEREAHHVAPLPADKVARFRKKIAVISHEIVRDDHRVHVVPRHLSHKNKGGATSARRASPFRNPFDRLKPIGMAPPSLRAYC